MHFLSLPEHLGAPYMEQCGWRWTGTAAHMLPMHLPKVMVGSARQHTLAGLPEGNMTATGEDGPTNPVVRNASAMAMQQICLCCRVQVC